MAAIHAAGLDMDSSVQFFYSKATADSLHKTYKSALKKLVTFCSTYSVTTPFPVSEAISVIFLHTCLVKVYQPDYKSVLGWNKTEISIGLPDPKEFTSMPRLRKV